GQRVVIASCGIGRYSGSIDRLVWTGEAARVRWRRLSRLLSPGGPEFGFDRLRRVSYFHENPGYSRKFARLASFFLSDWRCRRANRLPQYQVLIVAAYSVLDQPGRERSD